MRNHHAGGSNLPIPTVSSPLAVPAPAVAIAPGSSDAAIVPVIFAASLLHKHRKRGLGLLDFPGEGRLQAKGCGDTVREPGLLPREGAS
jgi:hypothetical protein